MTKEYHLTVKDGILSFEAELGASKYMRAGVYQVLVSRYLAPPKQLSIRIVKLTGEPVGNVTRNLVGLTTHYRFKNRTDFTEVVYVKMQDEGEGMWQSLVDADILVRSEYKDMPYNLGTFRASYFHGPIQELAELL